VGIKSLLLPNHKYPTFFPHPFFPLGRSGSLSLLQLTAGNRCIPAWNKLLCNRLEMDTAPFSATGFAPGSHPSAITSCPALPRPVYRFVSSALKLGGMRRGCSRRKKWRARGLRAGAVCFAIRSSGVCDFHPLPPHLPLHKTSLPRRVKGHFINTITKLLGSIP